MFIGLLFADVLELLPKVNVSYVAEILDIGLFPCFMLMILSLTSEDLYCIREIEEFTLRKLSFNAVFLEALYFCRYFYLYKWAFLLQQCYYWFHTHYYEYMSQSCGKIYYLKCNATSNTVPLVVFEFLNVIIFPYGRNKM